MNFGALAGSIGKALQEDNKRVALRTERAMDFLTKKNCWTRRKNTRIK